jgi:hypothetical protein
MEALVEDVKKGLDDSKRQVMSAFRSRSTGVLTMQQHNLFVLDTDT